MTLHTQTISIVVVIFFFGECRKKYVAQPLPTLRDSVAALTQVLADVSIVQELIVSACRLATALHLENTGVCASGAQYG